MRAVFVRKAQQPDSKDANLGRSRVVSSRISETNSLQVPSQTTGPTLSAESEATKTLEVFGHVFYERIGVGGMGEVYRCGDDALQRDLAIKVLRAELRGNADAEERFLREARLSG